MRHFQDLGLDVNNFVKVYDQPNIIYLLDGFDEIGTQSWSSDTQKMQHLRELSVCALKDLISSAKGGVLIAGREYYFNSEKEMLTCFGLNETNTIILECHNEFSENELSDFIAQNLSNEVNGKNLNKLPSWFPKRPLVIQILLKYASETFSVDYALDDICGFWYAFLTKICEREAKIYPALNPEIIKSVLIHLANKTRISQSNTGPISQSDLSDAFVALTGIQPNDESAVMLQRLPTLGRISADSPDRQFLDPFILNALRAEGIIQLSQNWVLDTLKEEWRNPLDETGCSILSEYIKKDEKRVRAFLEIARQASNSTNKISASDIVSTLCLLETDYLDFQDLHISDGHFLNLSFEGKNVVRLAIDNSVIERLDLTNSQFGQGVSIRQCIINTVFGVASRNSIPAQIAECNIDNFETLATTTLIKRAKLSMPQMLFVEMIRKIFFQPGAGRKEAALLRGVGAAADKQLSSKILNVLLDEKLVTRHKGDEGDIYKPVRSNAVRMDKILTELTLSKDSVWIRISNLS